MGSSDDIRDQARKRLKNKADFKNYLWVWLGVSIILTAVWWISTPGGYFWPGWAIGGMGIAAFFQALAIYGPNRGAITESAIDDEVRRMSGQK
ncbi:MAG: 2TM domain-containing protein [Salinibacterium sp.]|nr:2TM domain-containing protein [Salinibacterium sp.]